MAEDLKPGERLADQSQMGVFTAGNRPYLGDPTVVYGVLRDLIDVVLEEPEDHADDLEETDEPYDRAAAIESAIDDATETLCGQDDDYAPMGKWNTGDGLGNWIRGHMNKVPADGGTDGAVRFALAHLVLHFMDAAKAVELGAETPEASAERLKGIMANWTTLMLGMPAVGAVQKAPGPRD